MTAIGTYLLITRTRGDQVLHRPDCRQLRANTVVGDTRLIDEVPDGVKQCRTCLRDPSAGWGGKVVLQAGNDRSTRWAR